MEREPPIKRALCELMLLGRWPIASLMDEDDKTLQTANEEIEGYEPTAGGGWGDYPLDAVFVRTEQRTVGEVVARIRKDRYVLDPDFQREFVWSASKQSKLIESCVMRIPLPVFYVAEATDGRMMVVDGLQRLTTFARFLDGELKLTGLSNDEQDGSKELEGKHYNDLPINLQERVADTQLTMYILDAKAPERARLDIFERVNSGAVLTRQQMRNALFNGPATRWLKAAAEGEAFQKATAGSLDNKTMRDREAINRFCAFSILGPEDYSSGDMDGYLAKSLHALAKMDEDQRNALRHRFDASMKVNFQLFGQHAFRKSLASELVDAPRSVINISLFETTAVALSKIHEDLIAGEHESLRETIEALVLDDDFARAITYSTNSTQAVRTRFAMMEGALSPFAL